MERLVGKKAADFKMPAVSGDGKSYINVSLEDFITIASIIIN